MLDLPHGCTYKDKYRALKFKYKASGAAVAKSFIRDDVSGIKDNKHKRRDLQNDIDRSDSESSDSSYRSYSSDND